MSILNNRMLLLFILKEHIKMLDFQQFSEKPYQNKETICSYSLVFFSQCDSLESHQFSLVVLKTSEPILLLCYKELIKNTSKKLSLISLVIPEKLDVYLLISSQLFS